MSLARAALREGLRFARRHGYNLRYAIVVGGGEPAAEVLRVLNRRRDVGIFVLGLLSDKREVPENVRWLGGIEDVRSVLDRQQVDIVFIALPHADASRLTAVLSGIGDDPIAIHLVPDVFSLVPRSRRGRRVRDDPVHPPARVAALRLEPRAQARVRPGLRRAGAGGRPRR